MGEGRASLAGALAHTAFRGETLCAPSVSWVQKISPQRRRCGEPSLDTEQCSRQASRAGRASTAPTVQRPQDHTSRECGSDRQGGLREERGWQAKATALSIAPGSPSCRLSAPRPSWSEPGPWPADPGLPWALLGRDPAQAQPGLPRACAGLGHCQPAGARRNTVHSRRPQGVACVCLLHCSEAAGPEAVVCTWPLGPEDR